MINTFIPSFNRPSQLFLLLNSLEKNATGMFLPHILYKYSDEDFAKGYEIAKNTDLGKKCIWVKEEDGEREFYEFLYVNALKNDIIALFADDCIFYKSNTVDENELRNIFYGSDQLFSFTYRLGKNIVIKDYVINEPAVQPEILENWGNAIAWDYTKINFWQLFGFTVGFDGYIYRAKNLLELSELKPFKRICFFESMICQQFQKIGSDKKFMASPKESHVFIQQINVSHEFPHKTAGKFNISLKELNDKFLNNYIIDIDSIDWNNVNCTHGERRFSFVKNQL